MTYPTKTTLATIAAVAPEYVELPKPTSEMASSPLLT
jgi:hypothetical protein